MSPVAGNETASTYAGQAVSINVLADDSDPFGYPLKVASFTQGKQGKVVAGTSGTLVYTPSTSFSGTDAFSYTINDGHGGTATGTITVSVVAQPKAWPRASTPRMSI